ncbi:TRAP transporter substrate-binding protein DctP [Leadbettera azotonutricia]|uniref:Bacterial extracellular solute-binding protein, family 7 n=1 Tax=Leadbettera azotonutricia (strain ATCC BAA-888 / DSM 13862 / ZAS-9) TaxID=545695 RepID=F5Y8U4_LEAAZ|nr:TRAP transporter substrate-binding protein DctP [Leadbettera azotonutricia]AEF81079.1 bacterial extracellular solute-binding protein, family 7 [Leadbettera azotonutricia ZAS-9]
MKKLSLCILAVLLIGFAVPTEVFAQRGGRSQGETIEVKIASPVPKDSPWGRTLDRMAVEWAKITNNQVRMRVLHGGTEGGEGKMLLSLSSNTIQAAVFTSFGISAINPRVMTLSAPFLIRTDSELNAVLPQIQPELEAQINQTDYVMVAWSKVGWVNIFSKDPVFVPDDLKRQKIATNGDADDLNVAFKSMGFQMVETDLTDVGTKILSGAIMAAYQNPAAVAAYQLHKELRNMLSLNLAPFVGGIVMNQVTWKKIADLNPKYPEEIMKSTRRIAAELDASMQQTINSAITVMSKGGLKVNQPSSAQAQLWYNEIDKAIPGLLGTTFDRDTYQKISAILAKQRGGQ